MLLLLGSTAATYNLLQAQNFADSSAAVNPVRLLVEGINAFQEEDYGRAVQALQEAVDRSPTLFDSKLGSAAYWLGLARQEMSDSSAIIAWEKGWFDLSKAGIVDLKLADAYLWNVFGKQDSIRYQAGVRVYHTLVEHLQGQSAPEEIRKRYLIPLSLILPEETRTRLYLTDQDSIIKNGIPEGSAEHIIREWRRIDLLPTSTENEFLTEHLERIVFAGTHYAHPETKTGLDDRGIIYIRLGPPGRNSTLFINEFDYLNILPHPEWPDHEIWTYRNVDRTAHYIFIRRPGKPYQLGLPSDLIPSSLRLPRKSRSLLLYIENVYGRLALLNPGSHYGFIYDDIANFRADVEMYEFTSQLRGSSYPPSFHGSPPSSAINTFVQTTLSQSYLEDHRAVRERERRVPASYSNVLDHVEHLPIQVRAARFLDADGTTRTELFWTLPSKDLTPSRRLARRLRRRGHTPSDSILMKVTVARQLEDYRVQDRSNRYHLLKPSDYESGIEWLMPNRIIETRGDTGLYHLRLQWNTSWPVVTDDGEAWIKSGPTMKVGMARFDSLRALNNDPAVLEMSDLKPLHIPVDSGTVQPFANQAISPETPLALYFEIYHLQPDSSGQTHYTVTYGVARRGTEDQPADQRQPTTSEAHLTGSGTVIREQIDVDLSDQRRTGPVEITVQVKDEMSGQTVKRSVAFELK